MSNDSETNQEGKPSKSASTAFIVITSVIGLVLILGWAISTVFEVAMIKAFAMVILGVVAVAVALLLAGVA